MTMDQSTMENIKMEIITVLEYFMIQMGKSMKVNGKMAIEVVKVTKLILMVLFIMVIGKITKKMKNLYLTG